MIVSSLSHFKLKFFSGKIFATTCWLMVDPALRPPGNKHLSLAQLTQQQHSISYFPVMLAVSIAIVAHPLLFSSSIIVPLFRKPHKAKIVDGRSIVTIKNGVCFNFKLQKRPSC